MKKKNKGFTLIELIVTVAIIAIFSGVVLSVIGTGANSLYKDFKHCQITDGSSGYYGSDGEYDH